MGAGPCAGLGTTATSPRSDSTWTGSWPTWTTRGSVQGVTTRRDDLTTTLYCQQYKQFIKYETENIELLIATHVSKEARYRAFAEISQTEVFAEWGSTFSCVVCPLLTGITRQDYLPPYEK